MKVHYSFDDFDQIKNPVVTTGTFDGVHIGHMVILNRLKQLAAEINGESVLITFHPHPRKVLFPDKTKDLKLINTQREKNHLLQEAGLDRLFIINFTLEFSKTTSHDFVNKILLEKLGAKIIIVGFNHHFGHNREGDYSYLYKLADEKNFKVEEIPEQDIENEAVSSTRIRKAISEGHIMRANAYLNHQYFIFGNIRNLSKYYFVEIEEKDKLLPPTGTYAAIIKQNQAEAKCLAVVENQEMFVQVIFSEEFTPKKGELSELYFHKRVNLYDDVHNLRETDLQEDFKIVNELIY
jgi:riboflavin kinase/FMN adenylyltransferase